jgi:predicted NBD/HSP70 family sugar kinase
LENLLTTARAAADRSSIRPGNLGLILRCLREGGPRSRSALVQDTGLPKATISTLVTELADLGLVREGEPERGDIGRPRLSVELDGRTVCGVGLEINIDYIAVIALDFRGQTVFQDRRAIDVPAIGPDATLDIAAQLIAEALSTTGAQGIRTVGVTVAVPGGANAATGTLDGSVSLGWHNVQIIAPLRERLSVHGDIPPITLGNDAHLATVAEYVAVAGAGIRDMLYVTGDVGVGGGVYNDGRTYHGSRGKACEFGHMPINPEPVPCPCGRLGCWETMIGLRTLLSLAADTGDPIQDPWTDRSQRLAELQHRARNGEQRALAALQEIATGLARGIALLIDVYDPRLVVLGGYFTQFGDFLLETVQRTVDERAFSPETAACEVTLSAHGFDSTIRGAAQHALEAILQDPARALAASIARRTGVSGVQSS